jgi:hypothetical protein
MINERMQQLAGVPVNENKNDKYLNHPAIKPFMDDPYYREVLTATDMTHFNAAVKRLRKARGADAVKQLQTAIRKSGYKLVKESSRFSVDQIDASWR